MSMIGSSSPAAHSRVSPDTVAPINEDVLYEVVDNQFREIEYLGASETYLASTLSRFLAPFAWSLGLGHVVIEVLFLLDRSRNIQRRPDLAFVSFDRWPRNRRIPNTAAWDVIPNLAIEVISPSNSGSEILEKIETYFSYGVERVWVIYPTQAQVYDYATATSVRILTRNDILDCEGVIPGLRLPLIELFPDDEERPEEVASE
jgi:Uma2 family endonuclease